LLKTYIRKSMLTENDNYYSTPSLIIRNPLMHSHEVMNSTQSEGKGKGLKLQKDGNYKFNGKTDRPHGFLC
jgi:hypothetical protein